MNHELFYLFQLLHDEWARYGAFYKYQPIDLIRYIYIFILNLHITPHKMLWLLLVLIRMIIVSGGFCHSYFCFFPQKILWGEDRPLLCLAGRLYSAVSLGISGGHHCIPVRLFHHRLQHS